MEGPNYENYSRIELESVLRNVDSKRYPERAARVRELLNKPGHKPEIRKEQGFWRALLSKELESVVDAKKILKVTFCVCSIQLIFIVLLRLFFPEIYEKNIAVSSFFEVVAFSFAIITLVLGWFVQKQHLWAAYFLIIFILSPNLLFALLDRSLPDFSFLDISLVILLFASIKSIKFMRAESTEL
ncbi:hypothetical protein A3715_13840 [Oleiphilus sp. HI0009]|uniref:hypothetical protein n=1 Tax=unclassified Oleiphilus TaxID=2631174 RepID=UPI0007C3999B|nr:MULTISPECIES: hypothetical protein [unclassified Oleiphilus]KZX76050.1 hypothetical protein A3715_13840 [Oleiphilus sp. HI0009]KZY66791.1 hypothetical protein A3738_16340 [Oleiphilus sp. HI0066]KZY69198.1 hypothetical protein A3739_09505 [Oleiphilus sp. HI0067]